ncbi:putative phosphatase [Microlunatus phosphovorus NM-1]|uniref:Putative phosphatase n=1 Tax=Microlunatus phosphovorus (strain ATCC 700054 / DSM 10555 / JCM 9379 / NBRC 101784 / NCIMB 13414 / VKM Ac-1990 / NM-1) TaxID=1032480 RepID=F5XTA0_MICPN|nr:HAD-IA family hydrolase [Microlunatus phosphovorus]BAK34972.1 putative phosphatase [Microlunatus phosphovorus NM-1]
MNRLRAVVFDVDGTLVDSERDGHRVAFNAAFEEFGLPDHWDVETYGRLIRIAGGAQRLTAWFEANGRTHEESVALARRVHRRKTEIMRELVQTPISVELPAPGEACSTELRSEHGQIGPRPGVIALLDRLTAAGVPMHVATTGTRAWVAPLLDRVFGDRFDIVITGSEVTDLKPDPTVYREVIRRIGDSDGVVVVEDSGNGVRAAVGAGLPVLVTANPYTRDDDFTGATLVTDGFDDPRLVEWFDHRLGNRLGR